LTADADIERLVAAASTLDVQPRTHRWVRLPVCVLDAVFSINAKYSSVIAVCDRYAPHQRLHPRLLAVADAATVIGTNLEQPVDALSALGRDIGADLLASDVLSNRSRTSTGGGVLKAEAAVRYAEILAESDVHTLDDAADPLRDLGRLEEVERRLRKVPGNGGHNVRLGYLWMLAGDDEHVKPDRMVLRWIHATSPERSTSERRDASSLTPPEDCTAPPGNSTMRSGEHEECPAVVDQATSRLRRRPTHAGGYARSVRPQAAADCQRWQTEHPASSFSSSCASDSTSRRGRFGLVLRAARSIAAW
jgi:hypothetical protein